MEDITKLSDDDLIEDIFYRKDDYDGVSSEEWDKITDRHYQLRDEIKLRLSNNNIEDFKKRLNNYMRKHNKIIMTHTEITHFEHFENMSKEELNKIESGDFSSF